MTDGEDVYNMMKAVWSDPIPLRDFQDDLITIRWPGESNYVCPCLFDIRPGILIDPEGHLPTVRIYQKHHHPVMGA